jgi:PIN domain nuclease of toxin-antitoxin system
MRVLLDTHVLLWWHDQPARLTETAYDAINDLGNDVFISVVNGMVTHRQRSAMPALRLGG